MVQQGMLFGSILHVIFYILTVDILAELFLTLIMNAIEIMEVEEPFLIILITLLRWGILIMFLQKFRIAVPKEFGKLALVSISLMVDLQAIANVRKC